MSLSGSSAFSDANSAAKSFIARKMALESSLGIFGFSVKKLPSKKFRLGSRAPATPNRQKCTRGFNFAEQTSGYVSKYHDVSKRRCGSFFAPAPKARK